MVAYQIPERLARLSLLLEEEGLHALEDSQVMVLGLGGVGSSAAEALARGGIGSLCLLDGDDLEESNINRQAIAFMSTLGRDKADVMKEMVLDINPQCRVDSRRIFLTVEHTQEILSSFPPPDYVLDCIDTISQKLAIAEWCGKNKIPLLSSMGAANKFDPTFLAFDFLENTSQCSMSRVLRRECRMRGIGRWEVLYSKEKVELPRGENTREKAKTLGSMSYMPPIMGQFLAGKVICRLSGKEDYDGVPLWPGKKDDEVAFVGEDHG